MESLDNLLERIRNLKGDLSSDIIIQEEKSHDEYTIDETGNTPWDYVAGDSWARKKVIDQPRITRAELAKKELQQIYNSSDYQEARKIAGKSLGYSNLRLLAHENPVTATLIGICVTIGAFSGVGYLLYQYLSK